MVRRFTFLHGDARCTRARTKFVERNQDLSFLDEFVALCSSFAIPNDLKRVRNLLEI